MHGLRFIAGSGRSGTTWVLDALASANRLRPVFEPLHPNVSAVGERYAHRALSPEEDHPGLREFLERACAGRRNRLWTQYRCQSGFLVPSWAGMRSIAELKRLAHRWRKVLGEAPALAMMSLRYEPLVKCIWANLMLGWLAKQYGFRIVLIVRHPGAVVESMQRNEWNSRPVLERFRNDRTLLELTNGRYQKLLQRTLSTIEEHAVKWVIENQLAVETASAYGITVVSYEGLKSLRAAEWEKIRGALQLPVMPDPGSLARPSQQTAPRSSDIDSSGGGPRWQRVLTPAQKSQVQRVLDESHFDLYSMTEAGQCDSVVAASSNAT